MKKKKRTLLIICGIVIGLVVLREIGIVDVNLPISKLSSSHKSSMSRSYSGQEKRFSYHLTVRHKDEIVFSHTLQYGNLPEIEIEAILEEPIYTGNFLVPLYKDFKMTYLCNYNTLKSPSGHKVAGKIEGEVNAKIYGLCSRRKAKELAFEKAKEQIVSYLQEQLNK